MARKRPAKKSTSAKAPEKAAKKRAAKKAANKAPNKISKSAAGKLSKASKAARKAKAPSAKKPPLSAAKKARVSKAARKAVSKAPAKRTRASKQPAKTPRKTASATLAGKALPSPRRSAPRLSAGRRAKPRKAPSREALAKKAVRKPAVVAARKPAKRPAKHAPSTKAAGKTARSRLSTRAAPKSAPPVLRDATRRRVVKPTAPRPEKAPAAKRKKPFRLHALGVRVEHATDRARIEALLTEAFGRPDEATIVARLRADGAMVLALVAEFEGDLVGYIAFSKAEATIDGRALKALALAPLAVTSARRGAGVGSALVAAGLEAAGAAGFEAVFVVGDAVYYERFGFTAATAHPFESSWKSALMALELAPGALAGASGSLGLPDAFRI
jgi:putative acetyltransferase